jgi:fluoride ion exporter CrcB/FEX
MGWWGVVFKEDISKVSGHLAIGLTTGYLGSLTTFSGWNQKMLDLSVSGHWVFSFVGFLIGKWHLQIIVICSCSLSGTWKLNYCSWACACSKF